MSLISVLSRSLTSMDGYFQGTPKSPSQPIGPRRSRKTPSSTYLTWVGGRFIVRNECMRGAQPYFQHRLESSNCPAQSLSALLLISKTYALILNSQNFESLGRCA